MPLPLILPPLDSPEARAAYSFSHARDHDEIDDALRKLGVSSPAVPLDPMPPLDEARAWLLLHQLKHTTMNEALGLDGADLTEFDLADPTAFSTFAGENFAEHDSVHQQLKI